MTEGKQNPDRIEAGFRGGTTTVVGIMTAFSLGFLTAWGANPVPWELKDSWAVGPIALGIALEVISLARLLSIRSLEVRYYQVSVRIFLVGMVLVVLGVCAALAVDLIWIASHRRAA
jgi:hypothetical protein